MFRVRFQYHFYRLMTVTVGFTEISTTVTGIDAPPAPGGGGAKFPPQILKSLAGRDGRGPARALGY